MRWLALILKEVQQHGVAVLWAVVLLSSVQVVTWFVSLFENRLTLMNSVFELAVFPLPCFVVFLAGRLVVHDHARGTHEFLVALPIAPAHRVLARFALGLGVVQAVGLVSVLTTAVVAGRREGLPAQWLLQLLSQEVLHLWGWFGVAFGVAHLGRYRWLAWWCLAVLAIAYSNSDGPSLSWWGMMAESVDRTRLSPPWAAAIPVVLWGVGGLVLALALSGWRGGILLERWFQPVTAVQRATLLGAGVAVMIGVDTVDPWAEAARDTWAELPSVPASRAQVRVAGATRGPLWSLGEEVVSELDALGAEVGVEQWPPIVLVRDRRPPGRAPVRPAPPDEGELARVVRVDLSAPRHDLVRRVVREAVLHRVGHLAGWDDEARWVLDGAAAWWVDGETAQLQDLAIRVDVDPSNWLATASDLGPDAASAVAWSGLVALEDEAGREAVLSLLGQVLAFDQATPVGGLQLRWTTRGDWVERTTGASASWIDDWSKGLASTKPPLPPLTVEVDDGHPVARWTEPLPPGAAVWWAALDPSLTRPLPETITEVIPVVPGRREVALPGDADARLVARLVAWDPALGALVAGPWGGLP